jgi:hypothetical protein
MGLVLVVERRGQGQGPGFVSEWEAVEPLLPVEVRQNQLS